MSEMSSLSDDELLMLLKQGSTDAFEIIYDRYFIRLLNTSYKRLGSEEAAREIVQDIFVQLFIKRNEIDTRNLTAYLHTLLRNRIIDCFRKHLSKKKHQHYLKHTQPAIVHELPEAVMDGKMLEEKIKNAIDQLPEKCREVFILSRLNHLSHQAIAEKLTISVSTVEKHIVKALKIMRKRLKIII